MDQLHLINVFVAVVDTNGFAGAARKLNISPPAVTRAINELESHLGVRLLTRTTRVVRVTEAGARYGEDCRRILAELAEADQSASGAHGSPHGRLTLTAPVLFGCKFMTPIVTEYLQRYPEVTAACWFLDRVVNMMDEGVDVAVRIGDLPDSSMQAIRVGTVRRVICAAPGYLKQHGIPQSPDDLATHTIVSAAAVTPTPEWRMLENGEPRVVKVQARMITTTNDSAVAAAIEWLWPHQTVVLPGGGSIARGEAQDGPHRVRTRCLASAPVASRGPARVTKGASVSRPGDRTAARQSGTELSLGLREVVRRRALTNSCAIEFHSG